MAPLTFHINNIIFRGFLHEVKSLIKHVCPYRDRGNCRTIQKFTRDILSSM